MTPILPKHDTPVVDTNGRFAKTWYLFLNSLAPADASGEDWSTVTPSGGGNATLDLAVSLNFRLVLNASAVTILAPVYSGGAIAAGLRIWLYLEQDATGGRAAPSYASGVTGAFAVDDSLGQVDGRASIRTLQIFVYDGSHWCLDSFRMGIATS